MKYYLVMNQNVRHVMFSAELKAGTKKSHSAAENTKFVGAFLRGVVDEEEYKKLITNFFYVYSTMEELIKATEDPIASILKKYQVKLNRTAFLEQDLRYFYGPMWRNDVYKGESEACKTYIHRLNEVAQNDPYLLVAHHYTRYIGDLSGGQILKNIAEKALKPPKGAGLNFYEFPYIEDAKAFKTEYRAALDELPLDESQKNAMITEANYAFRLNMYLFDEIQTRDKYPLLTSLKGLWKVATGFIGG